MHILCYFKFMCACVLRQCPFFIHPYQLSSSLRVRSNHWINKPDCMFYGSSLSEEWPLPSPMGEGVSACRIEGGTPNFGVTCVRNIEGGSVGWQANIWYCSFCQFYFWSSIAFLFVFCCFYHFMWARQPRDLPKLGPCLLHNRDHCLKARWLRPEAGQRPLGKSRLKVTEPDRLGMYCMVTI